MQTYHLHSYSEVVISVGDLDKTKAFYIDYVGAEVVHEGKAHKTQSLCWDLPDSCEIEEVLLQFPANRSCGQLRLMRFRHVPQQFIRSGGRVWDTGGIYDIDLRVSNIEKAYAEMRESGWHGENDPCDLRSGEFWLKEVLVKGHDEVVIALVNRLLPPLENTHNHLFISNIYLSALICKDLEQAKVFFIDKLGFKIMNQLQIGGKAEQNMFGLPENIFEKHLAHLLLISPNGQRDTMLDLLQFQDLKGRDFSDYALPPNRGILMFRFPVTNLHAYYEHILTQGIVPKVALQRVTIQPYQDVNLFAVQSPDGVWLEFYEPAN
jgi:catechol 2,3-dioxygenase-like lactoylglutathione lyase family enzyme